MSRSIVVFGAGPGLGRAVARRYGREGYDVVLVARRAGPLESLARDLSVEGIKAHAVTADLSDAGAIPELAGRIRAKAGDPAVLYYAPAGGGPGFVSAAELSPGHVRELMPMTVYALIALVQEFLPAMLERGDGAILSAQGAAAVQGWPHMSGWPLALAAQRNYLQSLSAEVADQGVYVGMLFIGACIVGSAADAERKVAVEAGVPVPDMTDVDPVALADRIWTMHVAKDRSEPVIT